MVRCDGVTLRLQRFGRAKVLAVVVAALWAIAGTAEAVYGLLPVGLESLEAVTGALHAAGVIFGFMGIQCAAAALVALVQAWTARPAEGAIEVAERGITGKGLRRPVPHEAVRAGFYLPTTGEVVLTIGHGDRLRVGDLDRTRAEALLGAIAGGATERALEIALQRAATTLQVIVAILMTPIVIPLLVAVSSLRSIPALMAVAAASAVACYLAVSRFGAPARVRVGHDGIALEGSRGATFIPYARVIDVAPSVDGIRLTLDDRARVPVRLLRPRVGRDIDLALRRRDRLVAKIRAELSAWQAAGVEPLGSALLDRRGRSVADWRAALRSVCARPVAGYRDATLDPEHLVRVLEARDAPPERRLGAAMALSGSDDPALRRRVRVIIDTTADDDLREAIEEAARADLNEARLDRLSVSISTSARASS